MNKLLKYLSYFLILTVIWIVALKITFPLPDISKRIDSLALASDPSTTLGKIFSDAHTHHPNKTGVLPLISGNDALGSRLILAKQAQKSIDIQYYIWHDDLSGNLLLKALYDASLRGVKIRLLLDDNGIHGLDNILTSLNALDNFEIRIFNPSMIRSPKILGYSFDFLRMNRRMHNKSFIVDGAVAIIGGRNVGDEYFQVGEKSFFIDLDVIGVGKIVPKTASAFDEYWNSQSAYEIESFITTIGNLKTFLSNTSKANSSPGNTALSKSINTSAERLIAKKMSLEWTDVELVFDNPLKGLGKVQEDQLLIEQMMSMIGEVKHKIDLVSAYFIPGKKGSSYFSKLANDSKKIRILTNAMATTDVLMVHAGYSKYRRELLSSGVDLYELKLNNVIEKKKNDFLSGSNASLHAKTFAIDNNRIFIGSFNFDPRSVFLNCEMGFLIHSSKLALQLSAAFDKPIKANSYQPKLTPGGKMIWNEIKEGDELITYQEEPEASWFQQISMVIIGLLPVEWLL